MIATTSHPGLPIADSELQESAAKYIIHNHYVILGTDELELILWGDLIFL